MAQRMPAAADGGPLPTGHWGVVTGPDDDPSNNIGVGRDRSSAHTQSWCPFNLFRTSGDIRQTWASVHRNLQTALPYLDKDTPLSQPHCWAYPDSESQHRCVARPRATALNLLRCNSAAGREFAHARTEQSALWCLVCHQRPVVSGFRPSKPLACGRDDADYRQRRGGRCESTVRSELPDATNTGARSSSVSALTLLVDRRRVIPARSSKNGRRPRP